MKNSSIILWAATVAAAGFLFGFDTVVISGADKPIQALWQLDPVYHGLFIMSMALWGTVLGALLGGIPTNQFGRKKTLIGIGILFFVSAVGSALAVEPFSFSFFRFIGGVGVGASTVAAPIYISEISSKENRGKFVALFQFMIVFGIFLAFFSNFLLEGIGGISMVEVPLQDGSGTEMVEVSNSWRYMLGIEGIPALIFILLMFTVPESPRWLTMKKGDDEAAKEVLAKMDLSTDVDSALQDLKDYFNTTTNAGIFSGLYNKQIFLAFAIAFFNQLSGINFILYYAPRILEKAGLATKESLFSSISIGVVNLLFTMLGVYLIDRVGRKRLMYIGSIGYILGLGMVAYGFNAGMGSAFLLTFILVFIASHAVGQGAVIWVFISEIFPNEVRSFGQSLGTGTHWVLAALITLITPVFIDSEKGIFKDNPWPVFAFFAVMMVFQLIWVMLVMPETKGRSLEELADIGKQKEVA